MLWLQTQYIPSDCLLLAALRVNHLAELCLYFSYRKYNQHLYTPRIGNITNSYTHEMQYTVIQSLKFITACLSSKVAVYKYAGVTVDPNWIWARSDNMLVISKYQAVPLMFAFAIHL